jgi:hypothetical protein
LGNIIEELRNWRIEGLKDKITKLNLGWNTFNSSIPESLNSSIPKFDPRPIYLELLDAEFHGLYTRQMMRSYI